MKRKETILEQKLLENGYTLTGKKYKGKHSQLTKHYEYCKDIVFEHQNAKIFTTFYILIDSKRNKVIDYYLRNFIVIVNKQNKVLLDQTYKLLVEEVSSVVGYDIEYHNYED